MVHRKEYDKRCHELEEENKELKSKVVQLQTKYREAKYKYDHGIKEVESTSITDSESLSSGEKSPNPAGNLLSGFKNRGRQNNNSRAPKFAQSTKGLWGRMTNNRNMKDPSGINLAFVRD